MCRFSFHHTSLQETPLQLSSEHVTHIFLAGGWPGAACIMNIFCYQKASKQKTVTQRDRKVDNRKKGRMSTGGRWEEQKKNDISIQHVDTHAHTHLKDDQVEASTSRLSSNRDRGLCKVSPPPRSVTIYQMSKGSIYFK